MSNREIQDLWELFEGVHTQYGDSAAYLLLKISMQSALLDGIRQGMTISPAVDRCPVAMVELATFNIDLTIERWWSSIRISRRYADPPLIFYCFEKALEIGYRTGLNLVNDQKMNDTDNRNTR